MQPWLSEQHHSKFYFAACVQCCHNASTSCSRQCHILQLLDKCRLVNMAYLAVVGSKAVNGVAAIHSEIIKETIFKVLHLLHVCGENCNQFLSLFSCQCNTMLSL